MKIAYVNLNGLVSTYTVAVSRETAERRIGSHVVDGFTVEGFTVNRYRVTDREGSPMLLVSLHGETDVYGCFEFSA